MHKDQVNFAPLSPLSLMERNSWVFKTKTAVVHGKQRYTYGEFAERIQRCASALKAAGVRKGDRVAYLVPNLPAMLEAHFAVPLLGAVLVAINIRLSPDEIAYICAHSGAKVLVTDTEVAKPLAGHAEKFAGVETFVNVVDEQAGHSLNDAHFQGPEYEDFLRSGRNEELPWKIDDELTPLAINYTSGTTGRPKGVIYTHRGAYVNAIGETLEMGGSPYTNYLWTLPMFHCNGWCYTWGVTAVGGTHVCLRAVRPAEVFRLIREEKITHMCGAPTVLISIANDPEAQKGPFPQPVTIMTAGAPPSPTIIEIMEDRLGARIVHGYGLTETYGPHTTCAWHPEWDALPAAERSRLKARQGVPFIGAGECSVKKPDTMEDAPWDGETQGEVMMRGNNVMAGYYENPVATEEAFRGGWFHSGDIGVTHPGGYIDLRDRAKDIIISGGENISTIEVEKAIVSHPAVLEVAVVAVPDEKWGEVPKAFVTKKAGQEVSAQEIIEHVKERIAHFKAPKYVEFGDLPKTSTGKVQKFKLREKEWTGQEKRIH
ncbi:MAG: acyl-CoA synthetase [Candidatus Tectomicrobia bacterium RIFCSPLOWO2_12_FULL_69_37]|nr:MAG: acyl-CoA synthetase [Candidatus Tectomicrobia bacterium RIFCSPLOWO2_02_FULL_70_19]OGL68326.1 MAG: acyl-CoA synthetase [Candidatus Tectomicrobia bacterium RIFCSPLOWO2_12_FULL_69_37]